MPLGWSYGSSKRVAGPARPFHSLAGLSGFFDRGAGGEPDARSPKSFGSVFSLLIIGIGLTVLMAFVSAVVPVRGWLFHQYPPSVP